MNIAWWLAFAALVLLTYVWFFLVYRDVRGYEETQLKVLGAEYSDKIKNSHLPVIIVFYFAALSLLVLGFFFYFLFFHS